MNLFAEVVCPYCAKKSRVKVLESTSKLIVNCEIEETGCDEDFVVYATVSVHAVSVGLDFKKSAGE